MRSLLFLPGNSPKMLINGVWLAADGIIFDLEDSVTPEEKDAARILVRNALKTLDFSAHETIVRINSMDTPYWQEDLEEIVSVRPSMILAAKVTNPSQIKDLETQMAEIERRNGIPEAAVKIGALLENALGIEYAFQIAAASERVAAVFLGAEDLTADLRSVRSAGGKEIEYARSRIVNAARAAGVEVYDTPFTDVRDMVSLELDVRHAREIGFTGKQVISPQHIEVVNSIFSPTDAEIQYSREVLDAIREGARLGKGAVSLHGKMIDAPVAKRAELVVRTAARLKGR